MRYFLQYLLLEQKKGLIVFRKTFQYMILTIVLLTAGVFACSYAFLQSQIFAGIEVAVVIPEQDVAEMKMVTQYISSMPSVRNLCSFCYPQTEEALQLLEEGKVQAAIVFPDNFYNDVDTGKNTPAIIYVPKEASLGIRMFQELLYDGVSLLQTAEAGVYAVLDTIGPGDKLISEEPGTQVAEFYINEAFERTGMFEEVICSPTGGHGYYQYYFSAFLLLLFLATGLCFGFLYKAQGRAVEQKLKIYGLHPGSLSLSRILVMTNILWLMAIIVYAVVCGISYFLDMNFIYGDVVTVAGLYLLCMSIAAGFHGVYALAGRTMSGASVLLAVEVLLILGSGMLIPLAYMPKAVQWISAYLPLNQWNQYNLDLLFGEVTPQQCAALFGWIVIGMGIGVIASWKKS